VRPPGDESAAKTVNSDPGKGIERNLDAALMEAKLNSQSMRSQAETVAAGVPNVLQVVNELQVKRQKATSSN
jgi:hypothetical protein